MEPKIRYCTTEDGVGIAFATFGSGPALLYLGIQPATHLEQQFRVPSWHDAYERFARAKQFVLYDGRNSGLSDRGVVDISLDARLRDLHAVVDKLELRRYAVFGTNLSAPVAIAAAAARPDQVSHLILGDPYVNTADSGTSHRAQGLRALLDHDWHTYTESWGSVVVGWSDADYAHALASLMRAAVTPADHARWSQPEHHLNATTLLGDVKCPTLILLARDAGRMLTVNAHAAARGIAESQLLAVEGSWFATAGNDNAAHVDRFMGIEAAAERSGRSAGQADTPTPQIAGTAVILFTDIVSSTELTERMGDARFRDASRALDAALRDAIREAGGAAIDGKLLGDGVLATFPSAAQAIEGARRCLALSAASELGLHIGLHAGDVIREENNVFGGAVNIASRICGLSAPGEILVSDVVRGMARSSAGVVFEDRGEQEMKGVGEPVRVYAVRWRE